MSRLLHRIRMFLGCPHQRTGWPRTETKHYGNGTFKRRTYIVCLDCAKQITYQFPPSES